MSDVESFLASDVIELHDVERVSNPAICARAILHGSDPQSNILSSRL